MRNQTRITSHLRHNPLVSLHNVGKVLASCIVLGGTVIFAYFVSALKNSHKTYSQTIYYNQDFPNLLALAKKEKKLALIKFHTRFCFPCSEMDKDLLQDPHFLQHLQHTYIFSKIEGGASGENKHSLRAKYGVKTFPSWILVDANGKEILRFSGRKSIRNMNAILKRFELSAKVRQAASPFSPEASYAFQIGHAVNYKAAVALATEQAFYWDNKIYIQPGPNQKKMLVLAGRFENKSAAVALNSELQKRIGKSYPIIPLHSTSLIIP